MLMKKSLLLSAALVASVCAFAQEGTDITPANYKIQNAGVKLPFYQIPEDNQGTLLTNINIAPANVWSTINGDAQYNDGLILIGSGGGMTYPQWQDFMNSWNYIDFGGEIGRTACFITGDCDIQAVLNDWAPNRSEEWNALNVITNQYGGGAINFFMDPNNSPTNGFVRVKFVFNIYNNGFSGDKFIQSFGMRGNQNNNQSEWGGKKYTQDLMPGTEINNDVCMDDNSGEWDPTKWVELYYDFTITASDNDGTSYIPSRIKMFFQGGQATKESAMFFKEISFTLMEGEPEYLETAVVNTITLEQDLANAGGEEEKPDEPDAAVDTIGSDLNAPVEYFNLQGVKVVNPEKGVFIKKQGKTTSKVVL